MRAGDIENVPGIFDFNYAGPGGQEYHLRRQLPLEAEVWIANIRAAKIQPFVKPTDSVFEYGVGFGWNLMALECERKTGFDVVSSLRPTVEKHGIRYVEDLEILSAESFDTIVCHHTLEHLINPADALRTMLRLLKPLGKLLVFVPYEFERKYRRRNTADKAHHLYSWTPSTLSNLVFSQGFQVESARLRRFRFDRAAAVAAYKFRIGELGYRIVRAMALFLLSEYEIAVIAKRR